MIQYRTIISISIGKGERDLVLQKVDLDLVPPYLH